jgi:HSP20 family protein
VYRTTLATAPVFSLRREIDRLFEDTFGGNGPQGGSWTPAVNVREDDKDLTFQVELPGIKPEQVDITVDNGVLTIRGERQETRSETDDKARYHIVERSYGAFSRSFQLPKGLDESKIEAEFQDGVLNIHIPKSALPQPKRVQIQTGSQSAVQTGSQPAVQTGSKAPSQPSTQQSTAKT